MKKNRKPEVILRELQKEHVNNVQKLCVQSFEFLKQLKENLYKEFKQAEKSGSKLEVEIFWERHCQVAEAIDVKYGNEEQAWDYLS